MKMIRRLAKNHLYLTIIVCCALSGAGFCLAGDSDRREHNAYFRELMNKGKYFDALRFARDTHSTAVRRDGPGSKAAIRALQDIGTAQCRLGMYREAADSFVKDLAEVRRAGENGYLDMSICFFGLAKAYWELGRKEEAKELFRKVIDYLHQQLDSLQGRAGVSDRVYTGLLIRLADCYESLGKHQKAETYLRLALRTKEEAGQTNDKQYSDILYGLGSVEWTRGHYRKAAELYAEAMKIRRLSIGQHHPDTGACLYQLAGVYLDMKRFDTSARLFSEFIQMSDDTLGPRHPTICQALYALGISSLKTGDFKRAEKSFETVLNILGEPKSQRDNYRTAAAMVKLAEAKLLSNNTKEALEDANRAVTILTNIGAPDDEVKADALHNLGAARTAIGECRQAVSPLEKALSIRVERLGDTVPDTLATARHLHHAYTTLKYSDKAQALEKRFGNLASAAQTKE